MGTPTIEFEPITLAPRSPVLGRHLEIPYVHDPATRTPHVPPHCSLAKTPQGCSVNRGNMSQASIIDTPKHARPRSLL